MRTGVGYRLHRLGSLKGVFEMVNRSMPQEYPPEGRQALYINGGALPHDTIVPWLGLRIDTWYVFALDQIGRIELGRVAYSSTRSVGEDLLQHISVFLEVFQDLVRIRQLILHHCELPNSTSIQSYFLSSQDPITLLDEGKQFVSTTSRTVIGCLAEFDLCAALRGFDGLLYDRWLPEAGRLTIGSNLIDYSKQEAVNHFTMSWEVILASVVASLFRENNSTILTECRSHWEEGRKGPSTGGIITLVAPPEGTAATNSELFRQNMERLREAVNTWQQRTGSKFVWNDRMSHKGSE